MGGWVGRERGKGGWVWWRVWDEGRDGGTEGRGGATELIRFCACARVRARARECACRTAVMAESRAGTATFIIIIIIMMMMMMMMMMIIVIIAVIIIIAVIVIIIIIIASTRARARIRAAWGVPVWTAPAGHRPGRARKWLRACSMLAGRGAGLRWGVRGGGPRNLVALVPAVGSCLCRDCQSRQRPLAVIDHGRWP